ncbi:Uncharacterised protein [Vibrio vulnificus]|nr:Uncharacterised protein [Vibrio vulnificus]
MPLSHATLNQILLFSFDNITSKDHSRCAKKTNKRKAANRGRLILIIWKTE